jgi:hypothetical protein
MCPVMYNKHNQNTVSWSSEELHIVSHLKCYNFRLTYAMQLNSGQNTLSLVVQLNMDTDLNCSSSVIFD